MSYYIRQVTLEKDDGEEVDLEVHFTAHIDDDRIIVENESVQAFMVVENPHHKHTYLLTEKQQARIANTLEKYQRESVYEEWEQDMAEFHAESRRIDRNER